MEKVRCFLPITVVVTNGVPMGSTRFRGDPKKMHFHLVDSPKGCT